MEVAAESGDTQVWRRVAAPWRDVASRVVVGRPSTHDVMVIDPIGVIVWRALDRSRTRGELISLMAEAFPDATDDTIADALDEILDQLLESGVITHDGQASTTEVR